MPFLLAKESGKQQKWVRADPCKGRVMLTVLAPRTTSRWQISGPALTYHDGRNYWNLISQGLNNWTRLKLASEWSTSRQLSVFIGNNACDSSGNVNRRLFVPFLRADPEGKEKQNSRPKERCQSHCFIKFIFDFHCWHCNSVLGNALATTLSAKQMGKPGALFHALPMNSVSWYTLLCGFMEVICPTCTSAFHL